MIELITRFDPAGVFQILSNPTSNLPAAAILLASVVLVLLIAIVVIGLFLMYEKPIKNGPVVGSIIHIPQHAVSAQEHLFAAVRWSILVVAVVVLLSRAATLDVVCMSCHADTPPEFQARIHFDHESVECAGCHAPQVLAGRVVLAIQLLGDVDASFFGGAPGVAKYAGADTCLSCHPGINQTVVGARIRVSHREFAFDRTYRCIDCHSSVGHGPTGSLGDRPRMSLCLRCHNGNVASSECDVCHVGDVAGANGISILDYPRIELGPVATCRGCHSLAACNECHGLELPHPANFAEGEEHGPLAAFGRRELCNRCHVSTDCAVACHSGASDPSAAHVKTWRTDHARNSSRETQRQCRECHNKANFRCNMCHSGYPEP
ncbi:MAG: NapC/NirT family cytochrome c [Coriobacteriia bacterium]